MSRVQHSGHVDLSFQVNVKGMLTLPNFTSSFSLFDHVFLLLFFSFMKVWRNLDSTARNFNTLQYEYYYPAYYSPRMHIVNTF